MRSRWSISRNDFDAAHPLRDRRCGRQNSRSRQDEREPAYPLHPRSAGGSSPPPRLIEWLRSNAAVCGGEIRTFCVPGAAGSRAVAQRTNSLHRGLQLYGKRF